MSHVTALQNSALLRWSARILTACLLVISSGCAALRGYDSDGRPKSRQFQVNLSGLDWMEISYMPAAGDPLFSNSCRLSLYGSGEIIFLTGRSPKVWDSFSSKVDDPHWTEIFEDRLHVPQDDMQAVYQQLVDAGLVTVRAGSRFHREDLRPPFVKFNGRIDRERVIRITDDRRLVRIIERILQNFEQTALHARRIEEGRF